MTDQIGGAHQPSLPMDENVPEMIRFLSPSDDDTLLQTAIYPQVPIPFEIELYVKFPETEEPELFNVLIPGPPL